MAHVTMQPLQLPEHVRERLVERYRKQQRDWLAGAGRWPLELTLGNPTEVEAQQHSDLVRAWIAAWQSWRGAGELTWAERRWRALGQQRLPERLVLSNPEDVATWLGEAQRWHRARERYGRFVARWPAATVRLARYFDVLADFPDIEVEGLESVVAWLEAHPNSNLYPRQLPLPGMHTKWLEKQKPIITDLMRALRTHESAETDFFQLCGLRQPPLLMRMRVLDPYLQAQLGGLRDVSVPVDDLAAIALRPARVYIVENLQTALAFPELSDSIVLTRMGYAVDALERVHWLASAECVYWGDIDTHGFAILSRVRSRLPQVRSMLMDESTLLSHRAFWVEEEQQHAAVELPGLDDDEQAMYRALRAQNWGLNVRLEQERIAWNVAAARIA